MQSHSGFNLFMNIKRSFLPKHSRIFLTVKDYLSSEMLEYKLFNKKIKIAGLFYSVFKLQSSNFPMHADNATEAWVQISGVRVISRTWVSSYRVRWLCGIMIGSRIQLKVFGTVSQILWSSNVKCKPPKVSQTARWVVYTFNNKYKIK